MTPVGLRVLRLLANRNGEVGELARAVLEAEGERIGEQSAALAPRETNASTKRWRRWKDRQANVGANAPQTDANALASAPRAPALSLNSSEILENSERESSLQVTRTRELQTKTPTQTQTGVERHVQPTDTPTPECMAIAQMVGVQDIDGAWLKFTGHYAGKWVHVAGAWQKWCATEAKHERTERERERERAKNSNAPLTAEGLDPNSFEACQLRKKREKQRDAEFVAKRLAVGKANGEFK